MDNKTKLLRRLLVLCLVLFLGAGTAVYGLFSLQIINGEEYQMRAQRKLTANLTVTASRGEILDRYGRPLVTNRTVLSLRLDYAYWDKTNQNEIILKLADLVRADGATVEDELPISQEQPYAFLGEEDDKIRNELDEAIEKQEGYQKGMDAEGVMALLRQKYKIDPSYSEEDARTIAGVRFTMGRTGFSLFTSYIFAHDVSLDLISKVKEQHETFLGVDVESEPVREYKTSYAAHILGTVGPMYKEDWEGENGKEGYKDKPGYAKNSRIGKTGMEYALEQYLHGVNGTRSVETDSLSGKVTGEISSKEPRPGNNCILTIDLALQQATEDSLEKRIKEIYEAKAGAAVVIEVGTGEVLAMASYPTYEPSTYNRNYNDLKNNPLKPLINRATTGLYAPGSTYKPVVAVAALEEGDITLNTHFTCQHSMVYKRQRMKCTGTHGSLDVVRAIAKSCNIFFYNTGITMGAEKLAPWAEQFGLGVKTGIELGEAKGQVASPANREAMLENAPYLNPWQPGDNALAAIGQDDNVFTPLQIANYVATIASDGKHYRPHLLKSVKTYDYSQTVVDDSPTLVNTVEMKASTLQAVQNGMKGVASEGGTAAVVFRNYPIEIAGKSGTAQAAGKEDNGLFVAYAPYENPEIAICVVIEGGKSGSGGAAPVVRDILDTYFAEGSTADNVPKEYTLMR